MEAGKKKVRLGWLSLVLGFVLGAVPVLASAGDGDKDSPPAKADAKKVETPAPGLTERERWLLDRVEQLEKRVAELESKNRPATAPSAAESASEAANPV